MTSDPTLGPDGELLPVVSPNPSAPVVDGPGIRELAPVTLPRPAATSADPVVHTARAAAGGRRTSRTRVLVSWARRRRGDAGTHGLETLGRVGLVAYGLLHLLMAALAAEIVWGTGGVLVDQDAAIALVAGIGPVGAALLGVAVIGLVSFGLWQLRAALVGFRWTGGGERWRKRGGAAAKAAAMFSAAAIALPPAVGPLRAPPPAGPPPPRTSSGVRELTGSMLALPAGAVLVGAVAVLALSTAAAMAYTALFATFLGDLHAECLTPGWRRVATVCGSYGNIARAVVAASVGVLFGAAALTGDSRRSGGITLALRFVDAGPWGAVGLGIVVGGVIAFGFYCFIDAYARRA